MGAQSTLFFRAGQDGTDLVYGVVHICKEKIAVGDDLGLAPAVGRKDNSARLHHFRHRDAEWFRRARLDSEPAPGKDLSLVCAGDPPLWNDPIGVLPAELQNAPAVEIVLDLPTQVKPNCMPALPHSLQNLNRELYLFLRCNAADHHERLFFFFPWDVGKFCPNGRVNYCRAIHATLLPDECSGP